MLNDLTHLLPNQTAIETRFSFIDDEVLRTNTVITFRYIIFLINLEQENEIPGPIKYSLYKDMIIHTGTVIESCIQYTLRKFIDNGVIRSSDVMKMKWVEERCEILAEFENGTKQACGIVRHKSHEKFDKHTQFIAMNRACKRAGILDKISFEKAEKIRKSRNRIHIAGLNEVDKLYQKNDVDRHFEYARIVLEQLEEKLVDLSKNN